MNPQNKQRNAQLLPKGAVKEIANLLKCRPSYVSSVIHNPEKFSGPTAELVKQLTKKLQKQLDELKVDL